MTLPDRWLKDEPDLEFSLHQDGMQLVYLGGYPEGVVVEIGGSDRVVYLEPHMARRLGEKLIEFSGWRPSGSPKM